MISIQLNKSRKKRKNVKVQRSKVRTLTSLIVKKISKKEGDPSLAILTIAKRTKVKSRAKSQ